MGWMRMRPHICGIDTVYAVWEVLGTLVLIGMPQELSGQDALDICTLTLKEAARNLGVE
jgi:hypothetical protein